LGNMDTMRRELMKNVGAAIFVSDNVTTRLGELIASADANITEIEDMQEKSGFQKGETFPKH
jgi:hypothetical protein